eukprot:m.143533 g.143533  ORF g.143533 m.143533 type:complete len:400 (+) comp16175_c0_seq18:1369-2568(+)
MFGVTISLQLWLFICGIAGTMAITKDGIKVAAIRWDAWYWNSSTAARPHLDIVGQAVTFDMEDPKWQYRLPFYAEINSNNTINVGLANSTAVQEQQNRYAQQAGIDYWAFCAYPLFCNDSNPPASECVKIQCCQDNTALGYGLKRYLELDDSQRHGVNFTLLLQAGWFPGQYHGSGETLTEEAARYVTYFQLPFYQHVSIHGGPARPLVYLLGNDDHSAEGLMALRSACHIANIPEPYIVLMGGSVANVIKAMNSLDAQAISSYALVAGGNAEAYPFANNTAKALEWWQEASQLNASIIPPITVGWDNRPRQTYNMPWGAAGACQYGPGKCYVQDPTMKELTAAVGEGLDFTRQHRSDVTAAGHIILSAWDEFDEGHWLCPSLLNGTVKIEAVAKAIQG